MFRGPDQMAIRSVLDMARRGSRVTTRRAGGGRSPRPASDHPSLPAVRRTARGRSGLGHERGANAVGEAPVVLDDLLELVLDAVNIIRLSRLGGHMFT